MSTTHSEGNAGGNATLASLLPEFSHGRGEVGEVTADTQREVLPQPVLDAVFSVPTVAAASPGQIALEGLEEVVDPPGEDHNVVDVQQ